MNIAIRSFFLMTALHMIGCAADPADTMVPVGSDPQPETTVTSRQALLASLQRVGGTLSAEARFDGASAQVEYDLFGQHHVQLLSGLATVELTAALDGTITMTRFDTDVDDFAIGSSSVPDITFPAPVRAQVSDIELHLASVGNDSLPVAPPAVEIDASGTVSVQPTLIGRAHVEVANQGLELQQIESARQPIEASLTLASSGLRFSIDYDYALTLQSVIAIPMVMHIHYVLELPVQ